MRRTAAACIFFSPDSSRICLLCTLYSSFCSVCSFSVSLVVNELSWLEFDRLCSRGEVRTLFAFFALLFFDRYSVRDTSSLLCKIHWFILSCCIKVHPHKILERRSVSFLLFSSSVERVLKACKESVMTSEYIHKKPFPAYDCPFIQFNKVVVDSEQGVERNHEPEHDFVWFCLTFQVIFGI